MPDLDLSAVAVRWDDHLMQVYKPDKHTAGGRLVHTIDLAQVADVVVTDPRNRFTQGWVEFLPFGAVPTEKVLNAVEVPYCIPFVRNQRAVIERWVPVWRDLVARATVGVSDAQRAWECHFDHRDRITIDTSTLWIRRPAATAAFGMVTEARIPLDQVAAVVVDPGSRSLVVAAVIPSPSSNRLEPRVLRFTGGVDPGFRPIVDAVRDRLPHHDPHAAAFALRKGWAVVHHDRISVEYEPGAAFLGGDRHFRTGLSNIADTAVVHNDAVLITRDQVPPGKAPQVPDSMRDIFDSNHRLPFTDATAAEAFASAVRARLSLPEPDLSVTMNCLDRAGVRLQTGQPDLHVAVSHGEEFGALLLCDRRLFFVNPHSDEVVVTEFGLETLVDASCTVTGEGTLSRAVVSVQFLVGRFYFARVPGPTAPWLVAKLMGLRLDWTGPESPRRAAAGEARRGFHRLQLEPDSASESFLRASIDTAIARALGAPAATPAEPAPGGPVPVRFTLTGIDHDQRDGGAPGAVEQLQPQLPATLRPLRTMAGPDREDYVAAAVVGPPVRYRPPAGFDWSRTQPECVTSDADGRILEIHVIVVAAHFRGQQLHAGMRNLPVAVAFVVDNTLGRDERISFAKCEFVGVGFLSDAVAFH